MSAYSFIALVRQLASIELENVILYVPTEEPLCNPSESSLFINSLLVSSPAPRISQSVIILPAPALPFSILAVPHGSIIPNATDATFIGSASIVIPLLSRKCSIFFAIISISIDVVCLVLPSSPTLQPLANLDRLRIVHLSSCLHPVAALLRQIESLRYSSFVLRG